MARVRLTELGVRNLYLTRAMRAGDEYDIEPQCEEAARALGYVEDVGAEPAPVARRPRGRPRKVAAPPPEAAAVKADEYDEMTVAELREMAEDKGVDLPGGYVKKDELVEMIEDADEQPKSDDDTA